MAGTFSVNAWTNDAGRGIVPGQTLWAYHFGVTNIAVVNGVTVPGVGTNGNPVVAGQFAVSNIPFVFLSDFNNLVAPGGNGSAVMAGNFIYGGTPGLITVQGLTTGQVYTISIYGVGHKLTPPTTQTSIYTGNRTDYIYVDENALGLGNGVRVDYTFHRDWTTNLTIVTPTNTSTFHTYGIALRQPFLVTTNSDAGLGSLRQAALDATVLGVTSTIIFATNLSGQTITLTNGEIVLSNNVTIDASGLGSGLTISGNNNSRILQVDSGQTVFMRGLTFTSGNGVGAVDNGFGGAVLNLGMLTVDECTFNGNQANNEPGFGGGGIFNYGTLTADNSTFTGNQANNNVGGGGINNYGAMTVNNCTLPGTRPTAVKAVAGLMISAS